MRREETIMGTQKVSEAYKKFEVVKKTKYFNKNKKAINE